MKKENEEKKGRIKIIEWLRIRRRSKRIKKKKKNGSSIVENFEKRNIVKMLRRRERKQYRDLALNHF